VSNAGYVRKGIGMSIVTLQEFQRSNLKRWGLGADVDKHREYAS